jgi:hypothetical protein
MPLLNPVEKTIKTQSGEDRVYILSMFPCIAGREITAKYPLSAIPKLGDYAVNEEVMLKLMSFVGVPIEGRAEPLQLTTKALVENHVPDWETLARIELAMLEMNCSFFRDGRALDFLTSTAQKGQEWISSMLIRLLAQLSKAEKQPSKN